MLAVWLSQLILSMRSGSVDSTTLGIFERYVATLFGCAVTEVWEVADEWVDSLVQPPHISEMLPRLPPEVGGRGTQFPRAVQRHDEPERFLEIFSVPPVSPS